MSDLPLIEQLQDLCHQHGCPAGMNRLKWLDHQLTKLASLERAQPAGEAAIPGAPERIWLVLGDDLPDGVTFNELAESEICWCQDSQFEHDIEYVRADLAAPPAAANQAGTWQPIETAPKDGSVFLCWVDAIRSTYPDGEYGGDADVSEHDFCRWAENGGNGYWENMMGQIGDQQDVTHWMPLPAAPHTEPHALGGGQ